MDKAAINYYCDRRTTGMDTALPIGFECVACGFEHPAAAVQYDDLGYPVCPGCGARTGPLASVEAESPAGSIVN